MRTFKRALLLVIPVALLATGALLYIAATFDGGELKPQLTEMVRERTGRTLEIEGKTGLSFWPDVGFTAEGLTLSERERREPFATVDSLRASLSLRGLLARKLEVQEIVLRGVKLNIVRFEDGRLNIDDLLASGEGAPVDFDIGRLTLEGGEIGFRDLGTGARFELAGIQLETGRLHDSAAAPVAMRFLLLDPAREVRIDISIAGEVVFDRTRRSLSFERGRMTASGRFAGFEPVEAQADAAGRLDAAGASLRLASGVVRLGPAHAPASLQAELGFASLAYEHGKAQAGDVGARIALHSPPGRMRLELRTAALAYSGGMMGADALAGMLEWTSGAQRIQAKFRSPLKVDVVARELTLPRLAAELVAHPPAAGAPALHAAFAGSGAVDLSGERLSLSLAGTADGSRVRLRLEAAGYGAPRYRVTAEIDRLDLDRQIRQWRPQGDAAADPFDLSFLAELPVSGSVKIGELMAGAMRVRDVTVELK
jgi:AsmA protein